MVRILILNLIIILISTQSYGQEESDILDELKRPRETDSLYIESIKNYTIQLDSLYKKHPSTEWNSNIIYIQYESYLFRIPKVINGYEIVMLNNTNRKEHFRKNKNHLSLVEISALSLRDGLFYITLTPYGARLKGKNKLELSYSSYFRTYFEYQDGRLIFKKMESGGI